MNNYIEEYKILNKCFNLLSDKIQIPNSETQIINCSFKSSYSHMLPGIYDSISFLSDDNFSASDKNIPENEAFRYSIFRPNYKDADKNVILLMHGLNERSWAKYLPWAKHLAEKTKSSVILFPISFHMNRTPFSWKNSREMNQLSSLRKKLFPKLKENSFINAALSDRLQSNPKRFFLSGLASYYEIIELSKQIKSGNHSLFAKNTNIDFFSYSIGAFLTELLLMANPSNLFNNSKAFLFCGGATMKTMNGTSRFILDSKADATLTKFFNRRFGKKIKKDKKLVSLIKNTKAGVYFYSMLGTKKYKKLRIERFKELNKQIRIIGLKNDKVIPPKGLKKTYNKNKKSRTGINYKILNLPYNYTHITPFPVQNKDQKTADSVNHYFNFIFDYAAAFLNKKSRQK